MLDLIRFMLEAIDFCSPITDAVDVTCRHGVQQREDFPRTKHRHTHVLLHRFNR